MFEIFIKTLNIAIPMADGYILSVKRNEVKLKEEKKNIIHVF